ncbi:eukaryotic translation initiation factor 3 subunit A, partial [Blyttiomyces sp. JEL0837]
NVYSRLRPELRDLYNILEVEFHPLSICQKIAPIMASLAENKDLSKYTVPLHQLSQVYETISISSIIALSSFPESASGFNFDGQTIEKFVMHGCRKGELSIRINHMTKTLTFESDLFANNGKSVLTENARSQTMQTANVRCHLSRLAKRFDSAIGMIDPERQARQKQAKNEAVLRAIEAAEVEMKEAQSRRLLIEKKKEIRENEIAKKAREEERIRLIREQQEAEAEKRRQEELARQREEERKKQMQDEQKIAEAKKIAETLLAGNKNVKSSDLDITDADALRAKQIELLEQERKELATKTKQLAKRIDHTERAFRKVEKPLWMADYDEQKSRDKKNYEELKTKQRTEAAKLHAEGLNVRSRFQRMSTDYAAFKKRLLDAKESETAAAVAEAARLIAQAKAVRLEEVRRRREEEAIRRQREEEEAKLREEEERHRMEGWYCLLASVAGSMLVTPRPFFIAELEREKEEKARRDAQKKAEEAERLKKLDEMAEKQREKERLAEEKIRQRSSLAAAPVEDSPRDGWRRREEKAVPAPVVAAASAAPEKESNAWRPSGKWSANRGSTQPSSSSSAPEEPRREKEPDGDDWRTAGNSRLRRPDSDRPTQSSFGSRNDGDRSAFGSRAPRDGPREGGRFGRDSPDLGARDGGRDETGGSEWRKKEGGPSRTGDSSAAGSRGASTGQPSKYVPPNRR